MLTQLYHSADAQSPPLPWDEYTVDREYYKVNLGLKSIPTDIPADARFVRITYNNISTIPANIFSHLSQCKELSLTRNQITQIEPGAFNGLISLQEINLSSNKLSTIPDDLPASTEGLALDGNLINHIPANVFFTSRSVQIFRYGVK